VTGAGAPLRRFFFRPPPVRVRREEALRAALLRRVLVVGSVAYVLFVVFGWWTIPDPLTFTLLAVEGAIAIGAGSVLHAKGRITAATALLLALSSHPAAFAMKAYGVASPAGSLFLPTIVLCGLLVGRRFLAGWTIVCSAVVAWVAARFEPYPFWTVAFWSGTFVATAWLVSHLAATLETTYAASRGHAAALGRILGLAAKKARTADALSAALAAVKDEVECDEARVVREGDPPEDLRGAAHVLAVPLGGTPRGARLLLVRRPERRPFDSEERELARVLAEPVAVAMLFEELSAAERAGAVLEERNRIARDVHDTLAQGFTGIVMQLHAAEEALEGNDAAAALAHVERARDLARSSLKAARRTVLAIRPEDAPRENLAAAIERLAREMTRGTSVGVRAETEGALKPLGAPAEAELLSIAREAITNALRHAAPSEIRATLRYAPDAVTLEIGDNGRGSATGVESADEPGLGASGLRERASRIGAALAIESRPGTGTLVRVVVPTKRGENE